MKAPENCNVAPSLLPPASRTDRWIAPACLLALAIASGVHAEGSRTLREGDAVEVGFDVGRLDRAVRFVEDAVTSGRASGAVVLVARRGIVVAERAFGVFDPISKRSFTMETIYPIASISKPIAATAKVDLEYEPGTKTKYSAVGFATLGRVVEVVSGRPFEAFVTERVFEPLGMRSSYYNVPKSLADRVAPGFFRRMIDGKYDGIDPPDPDFKIVNTMPNSGAFSTAHDLAVFYQMFLNGGTYGGRRVLSPATVRVMVADQTPGLPDRWGLSWMLGASRRDAGVPICSPETFGHLGAGNSGRCLAWADPREDLIGIILTQGADLEPLRDLLTRFQHMVHAALDDPSGGLTCRPTVPDNMPRRGTGTDRGHGK